MASMTAMGRTLSVVSLFAGLVAAGPVRAAGALDFYYERSLMAEAGARCGLFPPPIEAALAAAALQARGAALRAGLDEPEVRSALNRASATARTVACDSRDLAVAAQRVRTAFDSWAKVTRIVYPGRGGGWAADRAVYSSPSWRLMASGGAGLSFGLAGARGAADPVAVVAVAGEAEAPYAARLVFRDAGRSPQAWLPRPGAPALPPPETLRTVFAAGLSPAPPTLTHGVKTSLAFRFPPEVAGALAGLDPRESFALELLYSGGRVRTAEIEVGDFAAGRAFLTAGWR
jgi:hypothetical protein